MKAKVRSKAYLLNWLEENGYEIDIDGDYKSPNGEVIFCNSMFDNCDRVLVFDESDFDPVYQYVDDEYMWLTEWLDFDFKEEVIEKTYTKAEVRALLEKWEFNSYKIDLDDFLEEEGLK